MNGTTLAVIVDVLEQMLARDLLTAAYNFSDALIVDQNFMLHAALSAEIEHSSAVADEGDMPVAKRRETEALVVARIFGIADPDASRIEQAHDHSQHFLARQSWKRHVALQDTPQLRQLLAESNHPLKFRAVAKFAPFRVIAILFASASVSARGL